MAETEKPTNVFELMANARPEVLEAIFEGLKPFVQAMNASEAKAPAAAASAPQPGKK
ncbi:MAG TPA: hypothetical protein VL625_05220 [Patescibacteria group bacterium]|nr:hypothetical protein [Patescibacteria group bacterium]